ncbi:MAG: hypothetical protein LBC87_12775 [Fibromonadaceae bacterium]|jgi:hypothetical protein|nr:hypothetical protein [Fibromonadaceae bacterium]
MKKFLYPLPLAALLCVFFFNCSNEGFEKLKDSEKAKLAGLPDNLLDIKDTIVKCFVGESCYEINKIACNAIGGEEKPDKECVSFACEWKSNSVEYGQKSTLSFKWGNAAQEETCSYAISYNKNKLDTIEYTISRGATFSDLQFLDTTSIVATATVTCGTTSIEQPCRSLKVKPLPFNFNCFWTPEQVNYGKESTLHFAFDDQASADLAKKEGCSLKISPLDTGKHLISASTIAGLLYSKNDTIIAKAAMTCGTYHLPVRSCKELKVDSIHGPKIIGELSFKKSDYKGKDNDSNYFFIGAKVDSTYIINTIEITNKEESGCDSVKIEITGSPAKFGTPVRATAIATCTSGKFELGGISAEVLPDPVLGDCKLIGNWEAMMFKKDTLFMSVPIENNYGRCKVQNDTLPLKNYSGKVNDITAKVVCGTTTTNKKCSEEVFVADKFAEIKECHNPRVQIGPGITVVEITCKDGDTPAKTFGCDCSGGDWSSSNIFTINGVKAEGGGCWATAPIPADIASKESKRVLIEYSKEIGCVAY